MRKADRPLAPAPRQHFAHPRDEFGFGRGELGALAQFEIVGAVLARLGELGAEREIADDDLRARPARRARWSPG